MSDTATFELESIAIDGELVRDTILTARPDVRVNQPRENMPGVAIRCGHDQPEVCSKCAEQLGQMGNHRQTDLQELGNREPHPSAPMLNLRSNRIKTPNDMKTKTPKAKKPLTEETLRRIVNKMPGGIKGFCVHWGWLDFARRIEMAHKIH